MNRHTETHSTDALEAAMLRALEVRREPKIPDDFAARIAGSLPALRPRRRRISFARAAVFAMALVAAALAFVLAPHSPASFTSIAFDAECFFTLLAVLLASWTMHVRSAL